MTSPRLVTDDLGHDLELPAGPVRRVVSLVPSLTEAIALSDRRALVGATDWCTHPGDLEVARVRGTKNPDREAIHALAPDVVICVKEENRELDVRRLREAGLSVWVGDAETVPDAVEMVQRMFSQVLAWPTPDWVDHARHLWNGPLQMTRARVAVPIWRDPWMVIGGATYSTDLLARVGLPCVHADSPNRYPSIDLAALDDGSADLVLLPDEPYEFGPPDGPEAFTATPTTLVSGRLLTWYGPAMVEAWDYFNRVGPG